MNEKRKRDGVDIPDHTIIISGCRYPCLAPVLTWHELNVEFKAGEGYNKRRKRDIDLVVWHWTGGEGSPSTVVRTLKRRKLGIEFAIGRDGVIRQYCDPIEVDTADAGRFNSRSVGVELVNYGFTMRNRPIPRLGKKRPVYQCILQNRQRSFAHFTSNQLVEGLALANTLSDALSIPRQVPVDEEYLMVLGRTMANEEADSFKGHVGHFHLSERKSDPGFDLLEAFRICWATEL